MWYWNTQLFLAYISTASGVRLAAQVLGAVLPRQPMREAHAGLRLEVDDEVGIVPNLRVPSSRVKAGNQARRQFDQHLLERFAVAGRLHDGTRTESTGPRTRRIGRSSMLITSCRSRYVVSGGTRSANPDHLALEGVAHHQEGDAVLPPSPPRALSFSRTSMVFMVEFHAMFAMKISSVSIWYGSPAPRW